jgi:hypothetical protein
VTKSKGFVMKSKRFLLGMLVMVLAFGMMVIGCPADDDSGGGGGGQGKLTVTGLSAYNGKGAVFTSVTPNLVGGKNTPSGTGLNTTYYAVEIKDGTVELPLWVSKSGKYEKYTGDDSSVTGVLQIFEYPSAYKLTDSTVDSRQLSGITFSKGSGTKAWPAT